VSSHLLAEVAQTVDEVLVVNRGRLLPSGSSITVGGLFHSVARFLPFEAETSLAGSAPPGGVSLSFAPAIALLAAVAITLSAAAARTTVRADVT
jgi:hypothetical protein